MVVLVFNHSNVYFAISRDWTNKILSIHNTERICVEQITSSFLSVTEAAE